MKKPSIGQTQTQDTRIERVVRVFAALGLLFVFLVGVNGLGDSFKLLGKDFVESFFRATGNPFVGLIVGILATTLVQSSSVTTALIVGFVAAPENPLPLANAVPMIMGANIGTTVTNTLVSLAHMGRKSEFRRAFSAATCHDFFNYMTVIILLPLELMFGMLRHLAEGLSSVVVGTGARGVEYESPIATALKAAFSPFKALAEATIDSQQARGVVLILISGALIFGALMLLVRVMRSLLQSRVELGLVKVLGQSGSLAILVGILATVMVQSSSITTSLLIPLAGAGIITLEQIFPITIGANIGTTITALLASLAVSGPNAEAGITIALIHLLFNLAGAGLIYPIPAVRELPLRAARRLAIVAVQSRPVAIAYVFGLFYGIPAIVAFIDITFF